jgi:hypothetical protein
MNRKKTILSAITIIAVALVIALLFLDKNPIPVVLVWLFSFILIYALWDTPKHKTFSYKDQQRAMRAFDRTDLLDAGKPDWAKDKKK